MRGRVLLAAAAVLGILACATSASARVLRVGTWHGVKGQFKTIQAAVNHAKPGDWILVAPGDYKEHGGKAPSQATDTPAGVLITTRGIYIRGMNRNKVVVDGTKPGSPKCSSQRGRSGVRSRWAERRKAARAERDTDLQGAQRVGTEPDCL